MMRKYIHIGFICVLLLSPTSLLRAVGSTGLVDGFWFSHYPVTDFGDTKVFSVIHNQTQEQLQGIATLVVDGEAVDAKEVHVGAGDIQRIQMTYAFSAGSHVVSMSFTAGNGTEVTFAKLAEESILVVEDTDGDGIQNTTDTDDDNDGIPDEEDDEPLVKQVLPRPTLNLSETGRALLDKITHRDEEEAPEDSDPDTVSTEEGATSTIEQLQSVLKALQALEDTRKNGAVVVREYQQEQRAALEVIQEQEKAATEGFEAPLAEQSKKREHQIAAAGAAVAGTVLEEAWLFYIHILLIIASVFHVAWSWFKRRFRNISDDQEDE